MTDPAVFCMMVKNMDERYPTWADIEKRAAYLDSYLYSSIKVAREKLENMASARGNMLRYIAFVTTGDSDGDAQLGVDRLKAREQELHNRVESLEGGLEQYTEIIRESRDRLWQDYIQLQARELALREAARVYMSQFGQALEAYGIPYREAQEKADADLRAVLAEGDEPPCIG